MCILFPQFKASLKQNRYVELITSGPTAETLQKGIWGLTDQINVNKEKEKLREKITPKPELEIHQVDEDLRMASLDFEKNRIKNGSAIIDKKQRKKQKPVDKFISDTDLVTPNEPVNDDKEVFKKQNQTSDLAKNTEQGTQEAKLPLEFLPKITLQADLDEAYQAYRNATEHLEEFSEGEEIYKELKTEEKLAEIKWLKVRAAFLNDQAQQTIVEARELGLEGKVKEIEIALEQVRPFWKAEWRIANEGKHEELMAALDRTGIKEAKLKAAVDDAQSYIQGNLMKVSTPTPTFPHPEDTGLLRQDEEISLQPETKIESAVKYNNEGDDFWNKREYQKAATAYLKALKLVPKNDRYKKNFESALGELKKELVKLNLETKLAQAQLVNITQKKPASVPREWYRINYEATLGKYENAFFAEKNNFAHIIILMANSAGAETDAEAIGLALKRLNDAQEKVFNLRNESRKKGFLTLERVGDEYEFQKARMELKEVEKTLVQLETKACLSIGMDSFKDLFDFRKFVG